MNSARLTTEPRKWGSGRALVTGAFGFLGRHTALNLAAQGYEVVGIGHGSWPEAEWRAWGLSDWRTASISDVSLSTYAGVPDLIVHCAGSGSVPFSIARPSEDFHRTVGGTLSVLEFIRTKAPNTRLILPSSAAVYGDAECSPIEVSAPSRPLSPYGSHKKISEDLCRSYGLNFAIKVAIVRFFSIYGQGLKKQLLWDTCSKLCAGNFEFAGDGTEIRDWLHVDDAAKLLTIAATHASVQCPTINGGTGVGTSVRDIVDRIAETLTPGRHPQFTGDVRLGDPKIFQADISGALEWGWRPSSVLLEEIDNYAIWYRESFACCE